MPFYHKLGQIPNKPHTQFRKPDGGLSREEVMGLEEFSSLQSILYHHFLPPSVQKVEDLGPAKVEFADYGPIRHHTFHTADMPTGGDLVSARRILLGNHNVTLSLSLPARSMEFFYRYGQLLEHAPYCERDLRPPESLETYTERGEYEVRIKVRDRITRHVLDHHPFDVVGWDGYLYPWIFNIQDFEPITGSLHQPPPVHQTFQGHNFAVCSFVPRLFDYHPQAIPTPYNHSNVNSDEVIYYAEGDFMSRRGIDQYDISLHPSGLPHSPQPAATEASIGKLRTNELAVMVDTFQPMQVALDALEFEKPDYMDSWLQGDGE